MAQGLWMGRALLGRSRAHRRGSGFNLGLNVPFSVPDALQSPPPIPGGRGWVNRGITHSEDGWPRPSGTSTPSWKPLG